MHMQLRTAYAASGNTCNKVYAAFCCKQALLRRCQVDATIPTSPMGPEVGGVSTYPLPLASTQYTNIPQPFRGGQRNRNNPH